MGARRLALRCPGCRGELRALDAVYCQAPACQLLEREHYEAKARELSEVERDRLSIEALNALRQRALEDPVVFFELVLRDESTQKHVVVPPHQKALLSFLIWHSKAVIILPVGIGKTISCAGLALWMLARNSRLRGAICSATAAQAKKPLNSLRALIDGSDDLRLIAPHLVRSRKTGDPWSDDKFTVDRPLGIRDPSMVAFGIDSETVQGSRLELAIIDDLLNAENTRTPEARDNTHRKFFGQIANRVEYRNKASRLWILNTTWHPEDYVNRLSEVSRWPTLRMSVRGDVWVSGADPAWDCDELLVVSQDPRPGGKTHCRLAANEPDPKNEKPLWAERYDNKTIEELRQTFMHSPGDFARFYESSAEDDSGALCKREFIVRCKRLAQKDGIHELRESYPVGDWLTFTGLDPAITADKKGNASAFFTFGVRPKDQACVILDIDIGHFDAVTLIRKLLTKIKAFRSYAAVENNAMQEAVIQLGRSVPGAEDLPIRSVHTGDHSKAHPWLGVTGFFFEMGMGRWRIPTAASAVFDEKSDVGVGCDPRVRSLLSQCVAYTPQAHTSDILMATFIARQIAVKLGALNSGPAGERGHALNLTPTQKAMRR